jgi:hypothetical protein
MIWNPFRAVRVWKFHRLREEERRSIPCKEFRDACKAHALIIGAVKYLRENYPQDRAAEKLLWAKSWQLLDVVMDQRWYPGAANREL